MANFQLITEVTELIYPLPQQGSRVRYKISLLCVTYILYYNIYSIYIIYNIAKRTKVCSAYIATAYILMK